MGKINPVRDVSQKISRIKKETPLEKPKNIKEANINLLNLFVKWNREVQSLKGKAHKIQSNFKSKKTTIKVSNLRPRLKGPKKDNTNQ